MFKQRLIGVVAVTVIVILVVGFWWFQQQTPQYSGPVEKITIAATQSALMVWLAQEKGFFRQNGLEVTLTKEEGGHIAANKVLSGEADIGTSSEFVLVSHSFNQKDLKAFGTVATADTIGLVARRDRDIQKPTDLKGKKVGVTRNSAGDYYLGTFVTFNQMSLDDIEMIGMSPQEIQDATTNGKIDAGITWEPFAYQIEQALGEKAIRFPAQSGQDFHFLLVSTSQWLQTNSAVIERFMKALIQTEEFIKEQKTEAQNIIIERFNYDPSYLKYVWDQQDFVVVLPQSLFAAMRDAALWKIETKQTQQTQVPNFLDFIDLKPLEAVKPAGISIIR